MKLVIDIPDYTYESLCDCEGTITIGESIVITKAIRNGTPLPKGHGRLIDANDCKKNKRDFCEESTRTNWYDIIDDLLDDAPTIIEADGGGR